MAITKNALIRYQTLDKCFRNPGRMYFWQDLLEECNMSLAENCGQDCWISRRQLFYDIEFMESEQGWAIPLERLKYGKKTYYRYSDTKFSINNQPLNETEANQIKSALAVLTRFSGTPQFEWLNEITTVLEDKLGIINKEKEVVAFDSNIDLKGLEFIAPLFGAIVNHQVLKIRYKSFKDSEPQTYIFHPYYLKQYNNRWFVFGLNQELNKPDWNLALDRIMSIEQYEGKYLFNDIDWDSYFYDIVGVTRYENQDPIEVELEFTLDQAPYIQTKPIHPTQKDSYTDTGLSVRIKIVPNFELENLILSFGDKVRVVRPEELKKSIRKRLANALRMY